MKQLLITIDDLTSEVIDLRAKLQDEFNEVQNDLNAYVKRAVKVAFLLGTDYFDGAAHLLSHNEYMAGMLVRANIENLADIVYILNQPEQANNYINKGMNQFAPKMREAFNKSREEIFDKELLTFAKVNPWAIKEVKGKNMDKPKLIHIEERINFAHDHGFPYLMNVYGFYCFFAHPNPGTIRFGTAKRQDQRIKQVATLLCDNNVIILEIMKIAVKTWKLESVTINELDTLVAKLPKLGLMHTNVFK